MKRKFIKRLAATFTCIILLLSLSSVAASAEEVYEEDSVTAESDGGEADAETNVFEDAFAALEGVSSEILSALSFAGSLIIAFAYRKGLLPTVKSGINAIGNAVGSMKESSESYNKHGEELLGLMSERLEEVENTLASFEKAVSDIAEKSEDGAFAAHDRAEMKALMTAQIDMLYDIFMTSSLPQYQKDAVSDRVREMKEVVAE